MLESLWSVYNWAVGVLALSNSLVLSKRHFVLEARLQIVCHTWLCRWKVGELCNGCRVGGKCLRRSLAQMDISPDRDGMVLRAGWEMPRKACFMCGAM